MNFEQFEALTFDCYGTLIDWESGILAGVRMILEAHGMDERDDNRILERFGLLEAAAEAGSFRPYRSILEEVACGFGEMYGFATDTEEAIGFAESVSVWPPFFDSIKGLQLLSSRYRLAIVSNVDDDLFSNSAKQLGSAFEHVVTAEQVRSYKPRPAHFHEVLRRLDLLPERVLHVAQSLYHDIGPAGELGLKTVWVNRRSGKDGGGATKPSSAIPDLEVSDLMALVDVVGIEPDLLTLREP
jgi:2-haloacid dehalogenase